MIILVSGESRKPNASEKEGKMSLAEMKAGEAVWWHISCMTKSEKIFLCVTKNVKTNTEFALLSLSRMLSLSRLCSAFLFDSSVDFIDFDDTSRIYTICRTSNASTRRSALSCSNAR